MSFFFASPGDSTKTLFQRIYSFFGFWTYTMHTNHDTCYLVVYWCLFPWGPWIRKFDLFRINTSKSNSINAQRAYLTARGVII